jgi:hypothetical protein
LFEPEKLMQPGGIMTLDQHLDALVEIAQQMPAGRIEQSLARVVDDICTHCPQQGVAGSCALRRAGACVLFAHARLILETIDSTLRGLRGSESDA